MPRLKVFMVSCLAILGLAILGSESALAQPASSEVQQISNFIKSIIQVVVSLTGLVAAGFFVLGGLSYITSSGNPLALQKAKRTLIFAGIGLVITIAAFALTDLLANLATEAFTVGV